MGSSFAAGPQIGQAADPADPRCKRSAENYAHLLAANRRLQLIDVSCSGATTADLLNGSGDLPAQISGTSAATRLVTITVGGNDLNYLGTIAAYACVNDATGRTKKLLGGKCPAVLLPQDTDSERLTTNMEQVVRDIRRRAPLARILLVEYLQLLPDRGSCDLAHFDEGQAAEIRAIAAKLRMITAQVARRSKVDLVAMAPRSRGHDICSTEPWVNGSALKGGPADGAYFHPNRAGMVAVTAKINQQLGRH